MKISLVIPFHNVDKRLFLMCMQSVALQTYQDYEVIIVNDGSSPEYFDVLKEITKKFSSIKIVSQDCCGASAARNRGVSEASGKYIAFLDADDMIMPYFFEESLNIIEKNQLDMVIGGVSFIYDLEKMEKIFSSRRKKAEIGTLRVFSSQIENLKYHLASSRRLIKYKSGNINRGPVARLIKRELVIRCPFHVDLVMWEDLVWNLELLDHCSKVGIIEKTYYLYYQNPKSSIHRYRQNVLSEVELSMKYMVKLLNTNTDDGYESFCDHVYDNLRRICHLYFFRKECPLSSVEKRQKFNQIYNSFPWKLFGSYKYYRITKGMNKIACFLFRHKIFFLVFAIKQKIKNVLSIIR